MSDWAFRLSVPAGLGPEAHVYTWEGQPVVPPAYLRHGGTARQWKERLAVFGPERAHRTRLETARMQLPAGGVLHDISVASARTMPLVGTVEADDLMEAVGYVRRIAEWTLWAVYGHPQETRNGRQRLPIVRGRLSVEALSGSAPEG